MDKGEIFRVMGGPTYRGEAIGLTGLFRAVSFEEQLGRKYVLAQPVDRYGVQQGGQVLLYIEGDSHPLSVLPDWICTPYRIVLKTNLIRGDVDIKKPTAKKQSSEPAITVSGVGPDGLPAPPVCPASAQRHSDTMAAVYAAAVRGDVAAVVAVKTNPDATSRWPSTVHQYKNQVLAALNDKK
jgi:hypothetical protein